MIVAVKVEDLLSIMRVNGVTYAGIPLSIQPYHIHKSNAGGHVCRPAKGLGVSLTETSGPISTTSSKSTDRSQLNDTTLLASRSLGSSKPDMAINILPGLNLLEAEVAAMPNETLQQDPKPYAAMEETSKPIMSTEGKLVYQLYEATGISLSIAQLCLSQSNWNLELALEAVNFAIEFARPNGLELQASILYFDHNLWDMDVAALFIDNVAEEVSDKTGMTIDLAMECLAYNGWTVKRALEAFGKAKVNKSFIFFSYYYFC